MDAFEHLREQYEENAYHNVEATSEVTTEVAVDPADEAFAEQAGRVLQLTAEIARELIGAHQSAAALIVGNDWSKSRKFFSLSEKYAQWADYQTPAVGFGIHAEITRTSQPMRFTQAELEAHPAWKGFGDELSKHPPMRGWLAVPFFAPDGSNYGLLQVSDRYEGDFSAEDEACLTRLAALASTALDALAELRDNAKAARRATATTATVAPEATLDAGAVPTE